MSLRFSGSAAYVRQSKFTSLHTWGLLRANFTKLDPIKPLPPVTSKVIVVYVCVGGSFLLYLCPSKPILTKGFREKTFVP